jgi:iron(III) transport system substrate-binding protein
MVAATAIIVLAVCGNLVSRAIPRAEAGAPDLKINWNPIPESLVVLRLAKKQTAVRNSILGVSWFWFIGTVLTEMGTEGGMVYLRELSKQRIANIGSAAREVLDQVIAGEYSLALQIFNHHTVISAKKCAPVDWIKMEPVTGTLSVISVHKNAPHPNAAKLLVDFITSSEGQNIFRDAEYLPADPTVPALTPSLKPDEGGFRTHFFTPEQTEDNMVAWKKVYDDLFR